MIVTRKLNGEGDKVHPLFGIVPRDPPANLLAEQGLLGAILSNPKAYQDVADFLRPEHFADPVNGAIYAAAERRIQAGEVADAITLRGDFDSNGALAPAGGLDYLGALLAASVGIPIAGAYGRAVYEAWQRRRLIDIGETLAHTAAVPDASVTEAVAAGLTGIEAVNNGTDGGLPIVYFEEIEPVLDVEDFVQGVLMNRGATVVYGESNAGKTFWTTDIALHVAAGISWNGRRVEQGGVIYCILEGGNGFRNRVHAWRLAHGLEGREIPFASIPSGLNLLKPDADVPRLIACIKAAAKKMKFPISLVVVDTLARAFAGGDENSSEDMGALVLNMDAIRAATGANVLFVHHCGKDAAKGARGHSSLRAAIDTEIEVVADPEGDQKTATVVKQREAKKGDAFTFNLLVVEIGKNKHGEIVSSCVVRPLDGAEPVTRKGRRKESDAIAHARQQLVNALAKHGAMLPSGDDYPPHTSACNVDRFRDEVYAEMEGETPGAKRVAFFRAKKALLDRGIAVSRGAFIWLGRA